MILDHSYFVGELLIPGIAGTSDSHLSNQNDLDWFIARYETQYLKLLLGDDLAVDFIAEISEGTSKYDDLKAEIYDEDFVMSPVAAYVYYFYWRNKITETTQMNEVRSYSENSENRSGVDKMVNAWNMMVDLSSEIWDYMVENAETYTLFDADRDFPFEKINNMNM